MRAYFGAVNRATATPTVFDAVRDGDFDLDSPPDGWVSLGPVTGFKRASGTKYTAIRTGSQQQVGLQVRNDSDATVEFAFLEWGKLQLALASGTSQLNLLQGQAVTISGESTAEVVHLDAALAATLHTGDWVVVDVDWTGQIGFVGEGTPGAYVTPSLSPDVDFIRRSSLNAAEVSAVDGGQVTLSAALLGGAPRPGLKLQRVIGFSDREGATFFQEWSGLFVGEAASGGRVCFYYPRLQSAMSMTELMHPLTESLGQARIPARLRALPVEDTVDGESVLCYRIFLPGATSSAR
jgi:hypothetical protein